MKQCYLAPSLVVQALKENDIITASGNDEVVTFSLDWLGKNGGFLE